MPTPTELLAAIIQKYEALRLVKTLDEVLTSLVEHAELVQINEGLHGHYEVVRDLRDMFLKIRIEQRQAEKHGN